MKALKISTIIGLFILFGCQPNSNELVDDQEFL